VLASAAHRLLRVDASRSAGVSAEAVTAATTSTRRATIFSRPMSDAAGVRLPWLRPLASLVSYRSLASAAREDRRDARLDTIDEDSEEKSGHK